MPTGSESGSRQIEVRSPTAAATNEPPRFTAIASTERAAGPADRLAVGVKDIDAAAPRNGSNVPSAAEVRRRDRRGTLASGSRSESTWDAQRRALPFAVVVSTVSPDASNEARRDCISVAREDDTSCTAPVVPDARRPVDAPRHERASILVEGDAHDTVVVTDQVRDEHARRELPGTRGRVRARRDQEPTVGRDGPGGDLAVARAARVGGAPPPLSAQRRAVPSAPVVTSSVALRHDGRARHSGCAGSQRRRPVRSARRTPTPSARPRRRPRGGRPVRRRRP